MRHAVIMAGGSGTRFWPKSRTANPKQFLALASERPLLQETVDRAMGLADKEDIWIVTNKVQVERTTEILSAFNRDNIIEEPFARDTAACIGLAAVMAYHKDPDAVMVVMPADHVIKPLERYVEIINQGIDIAEKNDALVTFGVVPRFPATCYGYIHVDKSEDGHPESVGKVREFKEKPDLETAKKFMDSGEFYWNSGIFVWKSSVILDQIQKHMPALDQALQEIRKSIDTDSFAKTLHDQYETLEKISIDYGILEKSENVYVVRSDFEWDDLGSWNALEKHCKTDENGNVDVGENCLLDTKNSVIVGDKGVIATIGVENLIIIHTGDAVLVADRKKEQEVKKLVDMLREKGMDTYL